MLARNDNNVFFHHEVQSCLVHETKPITAAEMYISDEVVHRHWKLLFPGILSNICSFLCKMLLCSQETSLKQWTKFVTGTVN